jgi:serralysin
MAASSYLDFSAVPLSGDARIDSLISGQRWSGPQVDGKTIITFSFGGGAGASNVAEFPTRDKAATYVALAAIEAVCAVDFVEKSSGESTALQFSYSDMPERMGFLGYAFFPGQAPMSGSIHLGHAMTGAEWDSYRPYILLHETLHALGLKHPFEGSVVLGSHENVIWNTVMSYSASPEGGSGTMSTYPYIPMMFDVQALQYLYGKSSTNETDTVYDVSALAESGFQLIWDAGGVDLLNASACTTGVFLDLGAGNSSNVGTSVYTFSRFTVGSETRLEQGMQTKTLSIAAGVQIENATGSTYSDTLIGNAGNNRLNGGAGDDVLIGGGGTDVLLGDGGDDSFRTGSASCWIDGGIGTDKVLYEGVRANYRLNPLKEGTLSVTDLTTGKTDTLTSIERLSFSDFNVALDMDSAAGAAAKLMGALAGLESLQSRQLVGWAICLFDAGLSAAEIAEKALQAMWGPNLTNADFVRSTYYNVVGRQPDEVAISYYSEKISRGEYTQATLSVFAAQTQEMANRIELVGLAQSGLPYKLTEFPMI